MPKVSEPQSMLCGNFTENETTDEALLFVGVRRRSFFALNCGSGDGGGGYASSSSGSPTPPAASGSSAPASGAAVVEVKVNGHTFDPLEVTIKAHQTVRWVWVSGTHNVLSGTNCTPDGKFSSGIALGSPSTFERTFAEPGTFPFFCDPHCSIGMTGKVTVE